MIDLSYVTKKFHAGKPNEFVALDAISLSIVPQKVTVLKGPSGSGKTTLLSILGCMARPTAGRVTFFGREITSLPERFLAEVRRTTNGFIFQHSNLIKGITCLENVMLPAYPTGEPFALLKKRAMRLLERLNVHDKALSPVKWLSGGETQRVAIARALINDPIVVIADEPTAHLDTKLSMDFLDIMNDLRNDGRTLIIASHDPLVVDSNIVDTVVEMRDGKLVKKRPEA